MSDSGLRNTCNKLIEILSSEKGFFGRVSTMGQGPEPYLYIGYEMSEDFLPTLQSLDEPARKKLIRIINYFEIHAYPLRKMLEAPDPHGLYKTFSEWAWSHFMTVVMFGMLEVAVIGTDFEKRNSGGHLIDKGESIKSFLEKYLPTDLKEDIAKRYTVDESFKSDEKLESFSKVIDHLWKEIRSGFVHEAGIESKGLEWSKFGGGRGTREDPIRIRSDVPMQELLQMTWQAILNSLGYKGLLKLPKYKRL